jgi:hypothetical protein
VYKGAPDELTPEQVTARASQDFGKSVTALDGGKKAQGVLSQAADWISSHTPDAVKNLATAAYKGALELPAAIADMHASGPEIDKKRAELQARGFNIRQPGEMSKSLEASGYQPKTKPEKIVASTVKGATAALATPVPGMQTIPSAVTGATSGMGSETAAQMFGDNMLTRLLGGLVGGVAGGIATAPFKNAQTVAREALEDVSPGDLAKAKLNQELAKSQGVPVNLSQAMPESSNIDTLVNAVAQSRYGKNLRQQLKEQPQAVSTGMERQVDKLPGMVLSPQNVANNAQDAASAAITAGYKQAGDEWKRAAIPGEVLKQSSMGKFDQLLQAMEAQYPNTTAAEMAADVRSRILNPQGAGPTLLGPNGQPLSTPSKFLSDGLQVKGAVDDALDNFGARNLATGSVDAKSLRRAQEIREGLGKIIETEAPGLAAANKAYSDTVKDVVDPLKKSEIGRIAGRLGDLSDREAVRSKVFSIFDAGTDPKAASSEILNTEKLLRNVKAGVNGSEVNGNEVFQDAVKTWMADKLSKATQQAGGRLDPSIAANIEKTFLGNELKAQGFKDTMVGLARSQGLKDNALLPGMQNFLKTVSMAARRPAALQGIAENEWQDIAGKSLIGHVGHVSMLTPIRQPALRWVEFLRADAYKTMDKLLTSPEGIDTLQKLAKQPAMSPAAVKTISTFLGMQVQPQSEQSPGITPE